MLLSARLIVPLLLVCTALVSGRYDYSISKSVIRSCLATFGLSSRCLRLSKCFKTVRTRKWIIPATLPCSIRWPNGVCCTTHNRRTTTTTTRPPAGCTERKIRRPADEMALRWLTPEVVNKPGRPLGRSDFTYALEQYEEPKGYAVHGHNPTMPGMFQGDIMGVDLNRKSDMKKMVKAIRTRSILWPKAVVPYVISSVYDQRQRGIVALAILEMERFTCLRLVPKKPSHKDYIFIMAGNGCYSALGRQDGGQNVSLASWCLLVGQVQHELMHAVGIFHEHSRADRDKYIRIEYDNVQEDACGNFAKYDFDHLQHLNTSYDLESVMHYGAYAFAKNDSAPTIYVKKGKKLVVNEKLGHAARFSKTDVDKLNRLYKCRGRKNVGKPQYAKWIEI